MAFLKFRGNTVTPNKPIETIAANAPLTNADIDGNFASLNDGKLEDNGYTSGDIFYANALGNIVPLAKGTDDQTLKLASGLPTWADNVAKKLETTRTISITGDLSYTSEAFDGSADVTAVGTLATVNSNVGSFGSSTAIPVVTVNGKGLVTGVTTASITTALTVGADSGVDDVVSLATDVLNFEGGDGITTTVSNNNIKFDIDSSVATLTGTQTLTNKTLSGLNNTFSDIANSSLSDSGVTASTYNNVTVNSKGVVTSGSNVAYLTAESDTLQTVTGRGNSTSVALSITNTTISTSTTSGALVVAGGVGIGEKLHVGGDVDIAGSLIIDGNLTVAGTTTTINTENLAVADNMIYLNEGSANSNPDLGISGSYNDGTYAHAGLFRDASDGTWKFFKGYVPEPGVYIDTAHASFQLADLQVNALTAASITGAEVIATQDLSANIVYITTNNYEAYHQGNTKTIGGQSLFGVGNIDAGANLLDDTTTDASYYLGMSSATSGSWTSAYVSSTKLYFNPSTGQLNASNFNSLSDRNLKKNVANINNSEQVISSLQGVSYDWLDGSGSGYGFIAQDIENVLTHSVSTNEYGIKTVNYSSVIPFLVEAVKLLQKKVQELESK